MIAATRRTPIGTTGVSLPALGVGTAALGDVFDAVGEDDATALVAAVVEAGLDHLDTAPLYGNGLSERRIGRALAELGQPATTLSTKVGRVLDDSVPDGWRFDFSRDGVRRSLDASLERLGRDRVDVLYAHDPDDHEDQLRRETWPVLQDLRDQGVVSAIGIGTNQWQQPRRLVDQLDIDVVMVAGRCTLLDQTAAAELLPACAAAGTAVVLAGVFNSGVLADPVDGAWFDYRPAGDALLARARTLRDHAVEHGVDLPTTALHFAMGVPGVASVVVGVGRADRLYANLAALRTDVPPALWSALVADGLLTASQVPR